MSKHIFPEQVKPFDTLNRPHYVVFPKDKGGFDVDDQYFIGSSGLLVKPVTEKDAKEAVVYLPEDQVPLSTHSFCK